MLGPCLPIHSKHGRSRLLQAVRSPDGPDLNDVRSLVQKAQEEIAILLYVRSADVNACIIPYRSMDAREARINTMNLLEQNKELEKQNEEIKKQLQEQHKRTIVDRLAHLERLLHTTHVKEEERKAHFEEKLRHAFHFNQKRVPRFEDALKYVGEDSTFAKWDDPTSSALLALSGHTSGILQSQRFCWLSAAALGFIDLKRGSKCPVACYHGQLDTSEFEWQERSIDKQALNSMISQIAAWNPECLEKLDYEEQVDHIEWDHDSLNAKFGLLLELLELYTVNEPIYLVFDGLRIGSSVLKDNSIRPRPVFLWRLAEMLKNTKRVVKVLLVGLDTDFAETELNTIRETVDGLNDDQLLFRLAWDSARLPRRLVS